MNLHQDVRQVICSCIVFDETVLADQETAATLLMPAEAGCTLDEARAYMPGRVAEYPAN
jgi:hypothetical protein